MELTFLGTSAAIPSKKRNHTSIALKAFGEIFLFDCGEGTQRQMARAKVSPMKIKNIFISHLHGDHILGLPGMIQTLAFRGRTEPLHIFGPPGTKEVLEAAIKLGYFSMNFDIYVHEIGAGKIMEKEDYRITCVETEHTIPNLAYCFEEKKKPRFLRDKAIKLGLKPGPAFGKLHRGVPVRLGDKIIRPEQVLGKPRKGIKITYSGDTRPSKNLVRLAKNSHILIHEATFEAGKEDKALETGHSTASEAAKIAKESNVGSLILTHLSTRYKRSDVIEKAAREIFKDTKVAYDLMSIEVREYASKNDY
ncbi:MAG TPA: ribonuclease Z [Methanothermobacter sp.]|nr:ribonuclease Z [Methanothermobacter sp.]HOK73486.1 ribonuclease Z [Methanothermobacter sp.]HOL69501.1 ribonuclease Z [Methanothermobacter sp.]HPQ05040.1 ribonuclease Z [Methanothermobacter sp.]